MLKKTLLSIVCCLMLATVAQAGWNPTGETRFLHMDLHRVSPGQTATLKAELQKEMVNDRGRKRWDPVGNTIIEWHRWLRIPGRNNYAYLGVSRTNGHGVATFKYVIPKLTLHATQGSFYAYFPGRPRLNPVFKKDVIKVYP